MKIIECPRDAMQGIKKIIPTKKKIDYINQLLKVGFDTIDFGSFVSPKAIPQMQDTAQVLEGLELKESKSKLLAIVANFRGAQEASQFASIAYLGFPLSISETFQKRNTNKTIAEAFEVVAEIQGLCVKNEKTLVVYLSMGFGNPYNEPYHEEIVLGFVDKLKSMGINVISLSDTIGVASPESIRFLFNNLIPEHPEVELGAHLHSNPLNAMEKIAAAYQAGCKRFDGALGGYGGCPMANDALVGNINTETILKFLDKEDIRLKTDQEALKNSLRMVDEIFRS